MQQLQRISHRHDAILNWMLLFPNKPLRECAAHFGLTQSYLSVLIHSDLFQSRLRERQDLVFNGTVLNLREKLEALAHVTIDKLMDEIADSNDPEFIRDTAAQTLSQLGYSPKGQAVQPTTQNIQINVGVDRDALADARRLMDARQLPPAEEST